MKVLFLGGCVDRKDISYLIENEKVGIQFAAQKVAWMFLEGLETAAGAPCDLLCTQRVSTYPKFNKVIPFRLPSWDRPGGATGKYISYINLPIIRYPSTAIVTFFRLMGWIRKTAGEKNRVVICYAMYNPITFPVLVLANLTRTYTLMIVPDLPEFTGPILQGTLSGMARRINARFAHWIAARFDGLVLFTPTMAERLDVSRLQWEVIEGCVEPQPLKPSRPSSPAIPRSIMYAGQLNRNYGVLNLINAFGKLEDPALELWICGDGELKSEIEFFRTHDPRIKYLGALPNSEILALQKAATILINPRGGEQEFTRYSFPSKNLEYLTSGRPVLICRMDGVPKEYYEYVYAMESNSAESMSEKLMEILNKSDSELTEFGIRGMNFVFDKKNKFRQGEKLFNLINRIIEQ